MPLLTENRLATLRAAVDRIIPADDLCPGGVEAGVFDFLVRHLTPGGYFPHLLPEYETGLDALDALARGRFSAPFATVDAAQQDDTLIHFEAESPHFFSLLVEQAQEGFYTSPTAHAMIGWRTTG